MKKTLKQISAIVLIAFTTVAFTAAPAEKKEVNIKTSKVTWKGYKVTGSHQGTIAIKSGFLSFEGNKLTGGECIIDMTSLTNTDLEGEYKGKLEGHLKSDDFFGVEKYPTAKLTITKAKASGKNSYDVTGNISIKGKTNSINFVLSVYGNKANASLKIDRSKFDVRYGSTSFFDDLKDKAIYDDFDLIIDLEL